MQVVEGVQCPFQVRSIAQNAVGTLAEIRPVRDQDVHGRQIRIGFVDVIDDVDPERGEPGAQPLGILITVRGTEEDENGCHVECGRGIVVEATGSGRTQTVRSTALCRCAGLCNVGAPGAR